MTVQQLRDIVKESGIVGAGGAGFPTYGKMDERADTILLNCAECEPLLRLHRQLLKEHAKEIVKTFAMMAEVLDAKEAIIGIKEEYRSTIEALEQYLLFYPKVRLHLLPGVYPMGDEVVLIYEATGKVIAPGGLPIEVGVAVFNVETVYNVYRATKEATPVVDKLVTVVGEVKNPVTVRVPIGVSLKEVVAMAGGEIGEETDRDVSDLVYLVGGPMMGRIGHRYDPVTKTTNAILVLPKDHIIIQRKQMSTGIGVKRAASSCCQCRMCTDLCPRYNLGHPIEPHRFMQAMTSNNYNDLEAFLNLFFCSGCGLCEMFACPQSLSPRTLIGECKEGLRKAGIKAPKDVEAAPVRESRAYRKVPEKRLTSRLGLSKYATKAPLNDTLQMTVAGQPIKTVRILLSQHIGAPAECMVHVGDRVERGQMIAGAAKGLSVPVHASISGTVTDINEKYIEITIS